MANRDKSQGVGFVYTNIYELYKKAKNEAPVMNSNTRVLRAEDLGQIKITRFEPRKLSSASLPAADAPSQNEAHKPNGNPFDDLKSNLNRLQDLHSKLRFMLKELEDLVKDKK